MGAVDLPCEGGCRAALTSRICPAVFARSAGSVDAASFGDRMVGTSLFFLGEQAQARAHHRPCLANYAAPVHRSHVIRFQLDLPVTARRMLAQILWVQGFPDQAMRTATDNVEYARSIGHVVSWLYALEAACLVALYFVQDLSQAQRHLDMLCEQSERHAVTRWHAQPLLPCAAAGQAWRSRGGAARVARGLRGSARVALLIRYAPFLADIAQAAAQGMPGRGLELIDEALASVERTDERWCMAELLRIKGELLLQEGHRARGGHRTVRGWPGLGASPRRTVVGAALRDEPRAAVARPRPGVKRRVELLPPIYNRFTEGFATSDLGVARSLIEEMA